MIRKIFLQKSGLIIAALIFLTAPCAFAKKDLFGNGANSSSVPAAENSKLPEPVAAISSDTSIVQPLAVGTNTPLDQSPALLETQLLPSEIQKEKEKEKEKESERKSSSLWIDTKNSLSHLRDEIVSLKDRVLGRPKKNKETNTSLPAPTNVQATDYAALETKLSPTDAVKKAMTVTQGQVINLIKFQDNDRTLYSVKLLQKDGRMRSVMLDANTGDILEDANEPAEE